MKPILFSTEMVQAILAGRKTQTRRVNKEWNDYCEPLSEFIDNKKRTYAVQNYGDKEHTDYVSLCERGMPICKGDLLWVRETWAGISYCSTDGNLGFGVHYKAGGKNKYFEFDDNERFHHFGQMIIKNDGWIPSIFMPKEAARLFLKVTNVRCERLQDISEKDAIAEGIRIGMTSNYSAFYSCADAFKSLWNSINAKRGFGWETNPFVWVYEFKRVEVEG